MLSVEILRTPTRQTVSNFQKFLPNMVFRRKYDEGNVRDIGNRYFLTE